MMRVSTPFLKCLKQKALRYTRIYVHTLWTWSFISFVDTQTLPLKTHTNTPMQACTCLQLTVLLSSFSGWWKLKFSGSRKQVQPEGLILTIWTPLWCQCQQNAARLSISRRGREAEGNLSLTLNFIDTHTQHTHIETFTYWTLSHSSSLSYMTGLLFYNMFYTILFSLHAYSPLNLHLFPTTPI